MHLYSIVLLMNWRKKMTKLLPKLISVKVLLSNGVSPDEKIYKIDPTQDCYDTITIGDYVLLPSIHEKNTVSVGRILSLDTQKEEIILSDYLENVICQIEVDEFKLIEGLDIQ